LRIWSLHLHNNYNKQLAIVIIMWLLPTAICNNCDANHTCTRPGNCVCPIGWTGPDCNI